MVLLCVELNWQNCGFLAQSQQAVVSFPILWSLSLFTNLARLDQPLHEELQCLQLFVLVQRPAFLSFWSKNPTNSTYGLTYCCVFLQNLAPCCASATHVNKHDISHLLLTSCKLKCNSAGQDRRYCSIDMKCLQAEQWTEARWASFTRLNQQDKRCFCHQATHTHRQSQCSSLCYLMRLF